MSRGQRFEVDLDSDSEDDGAAKGSKTRTAETTSLSFNLVKDVTEKEVDAGVPPPPPPQLKPGNTGFPAHHKRQLPSRFGQQRRASKEGQNPPARTRGGNGSNFNSNATVLPMSSSQKDTLALSESERIDAENSQTLASMSEEEIAQERAELLSGGIPGLTPSLIERLLKRADIAKGTSEMSSEAAGGNLAKEPHNSDRTPSTDLPNQISPKDQPRDSAPRKIVSFATTPLISTQSPPASSNQTTHPLSQTDPQRTRQATSHDPDAAPLRPPPGLFPASNPSAAPGAPPIHWPAPSQPFTDLDPSSPSFQSDLQQKYFPNLSHDPGSLSWMRPPSPSTSYSPSASSLAASELRFDFRGRLVPPSVSAVLPSTLGLHHHAQEPSAAGYTIPELAILQRSTVPAQRVVAHQTLGRILYRLGSGEWGKKGEEMGEEIWKVVKRERVIDVLMAEAQRAEHGRGGRSAWAVATEAVWLWQKSGGKGWAEGATR